MLGNRKSVVMTVPTPALISYRARDRADPHGAQMSSSDPADGHGVRYGAVSHSRRLSSIKHWAACAVAMLPSFGRRIALKELQNVHKRRISISRTKKASSHRFRLRASAGEAGAEPSEGGGSHRCPPRFGRMRGSERIAQRTQHKR